MCAYFKSCHYFKCATILYLDSFRYVCHDSCQLHIWLPMSLLPTIIFTFYMPYCKKFTESMASFKPLTPKPPILDTAVEINWDEENQCGQENVPGMRVLQEAIKGDV